MSIEERLARIERAVGALIAGMSDTEPEHFYCVEAGLPIRFVFRTRDDDDGLDVSFEPA